MNAKQKKQVSTIADELRVLYEKYGTLNPHVVVAWAEKHPGSALYGKFEWNDSKAAKEYRLWQARELITHVEVIYPDGKARQAYVSPIDTRKKGGGYVSLVEVMSDTQRRRSFLKQALDEYERVGEKYRDLDELASVRTAVRRVAAGHSRRQRRA